MGLRWAQAVCVLLRGSAAQEPPRLARGLRPGRTRLPWVDWARTAAIYNVVVMHIAWTLGDAANPAGIRFTTDTLTTFTMPVIFLVSGFVASLSWRRGRAGALGHTRKRVRRLLLPWLFGTLFSVVPHDWLIHHHPLSLLPGQEANATHSAGSPAVWSPNPWRLFLGSEMWFFAMLCAFSCAHWPWCHAIHLVAGSPACSPSCDPPALWATARVAPSPDGGAQADRGRAAEPACADELDECVKWAESGECTTNPSFMLVRCKRSCKACAPGPK